MSARFICVHCNQKHCNDGPHICPQMHTFSGTIVEETEPYKCLRCSTLFYGMIGHKCILDTMCKFCKEENKYYPNNHACRIELLHELNNDDEFGAMPTVDDKAITCQFETWWDRPMPDYNSKFNSNNYTSYISQTTHKPSAFDSYKYSMFDNQNVQSYNNQNLQHNKNYTKERDEQLAKEEEELIRALRESYEASINQQEEMQLEFVKKLSLDNEPKIITLRDLSQDLEDELDCNTPSTSSEDENIEDNIAD
jgi:hypothetical protein